MAGVLRVRANQPHRAVPHLTRQHRRRRARTADNQLYSQAIQSLPSHANVQIMQRTFGNQTVCRIVQAQGEEKKPQRKSPGAQNLPKRLPVEHPEQMHLIYSGETARSVDNLSKDSHLAEARKNGLAEVLAWEQRGSGRLMRTTAQSGSFYKWLANRIDKFPGPRALGENQYWAIDPKRGRVFLCTLHVVSTEMEDREERARERVRAPSAGEAAAGPGSAATSELNPQTAALMRGLSLLPVYMNWLAVGGKKNDPFLTIPSSWYLKSRVAEQWNLFEFFGIGNLARVMEQQAFIYQFNAYMFQANANRVGEALGKTIPITGPSDMEIMGFLQLSLKESGMPPLQVQMVLAEIMAENLHRKMKGFKQAVQSKDPSQMLPMSMSMLSTLNALLSVQYAGLAVLIKGGKDDSGFWATCGKSDLQRQYFLKRLVGNVKYLKRFLLELNIKEKTIFQAMLPLLIAIAAGQGLSQSRK